MKDSTKRMVSKYGENQCIKAFKMYDDGNGGGTRTVGQNLGVSTNTADALINAGRDISESKPKFKMSGKKKHFDKPADFEFLTVEAAIEKLEWLFLNEPNSIYNMYRNIFTGIYSLRKESKSNG